MAGLAAGLADVAQHLKNAGIERVVINKTEIVTPCAWVVLDSLPTEHLSGHHREAGVYVYLVADASPGDDVRALESLDVLLDKLDATSLAYGDQDVIVVGIDLPSGGTTVPALRVPILHTL
jgi:hypothetical protein